MQIEIFNSYCKVSGGSFQANDLIHRVLTYHNDIEMEKGNIFYRLKMLKRYGLKRKVDEDDFSLQDRIQKERQKLFDDIKKLEQTEWVCWYQDHTFPTGHLNIVKECLSRINENVEYLDRRIVPKQDVILRWNSKPFDPRYYQQGAISAALAAHRGVIVSAVGTGKSLMMAYLVKELSTTALIVAPSAGLSEQLYQDFKVWFGHGKVEQINAEKVRSSSNLKPIRIITIQSLASLLKSGEIKKLVSDVNSLYIDEIHHAGASSYTNLLPEIDHIYYRFGFTGTFMRNDSKLLDMWGFLSNVLYTYTAKQAIQDGFLTPLEVNMYQMMSKAAKRYQKEYDNAYCGNQDLLEKVLDICSTVKKDDQVLILVNRKDKAGKIFYDYLNQMGVNCSYISGDNKKEEINQTIRMFNEKKIRVLIGSSVIGEGIDVRSTDHLIMCQGGKSEIAIVQAVGRGIRLFDGKFTAYVHDFRFVGTKYMEKHALERQEIYERNFDVKVNHIVAS